MVDLARVACILFDLDGVLVDSRAPIAGSLNLALADLGFPPEPEEALHDWIGHSLHEAFSALLRARGSPVDPVPRLVERYRHHYRRVSLTGTRCFPGIGAALRVLASRHRLAVATSKPEAFAVPILESVGLIDAFERVVGPPLRATHLEDKTATVGRALRAMGVRPRLEAGARAAMVGDRHVDIAAGRRHGTATVGVTWGIGGARELCDAGADLLIDTPASLPRVFAARDAG